MRSPQSNVPFDISFKKAFEISTTPVQELVYYPLNIAVLYFQNT